MSSPVADRKSVTSVVSFGPPAIQNRQVQSSIENRFLTTRSGSLERPTRIVEPQVDTLDHVPAKVDVVIFDEYHSVGESRIEPHVGDKADKSLGRFVFGMGLAGEDDLHGTL